MLGLHMNNTRPCYDYSGNNHINFSESYHKIVEKNNYKNSDINKVIAKNIYDNLRNNVNYLQQTQYNPIQRDNSAPYISVNRLQRAPIKCPSCSKKKEALNKNIDNSNNLSNQSHTANITGIPHYYKAHNLTKIDDNNIQIHQCVPSIDSEIETLFDSDKNEETDQLHKSQQQQQQQSDKMNYSDYYNYHHNNMNNYGYNYSPYQNIDKNYTADVMIRQHNLHGKNNLMFEHNGIPNGLYDQSNFTGDNNLGCHSSAGALGHSGPMYNRMEKNDMLCYNNPMAYENIGYKPYMMPMMPFNPYMNRNNMNQNYVYESNKMISSTNGINGTDGTINNNATPKTPALVANNMKNEQQNKCRKNTSKLRKGDIDINIESGALGNKGISIDLNIGF